MNETLSLSSLKEFFRFPFREGQWGRFLIGVGLIFAGFIIPIVPLIFVFGYIVQVMRPVIEGESPDMPPWDDWGRLALDGLKFMGVNMAYMLPGALVMFLGMALYFGSSMTLPFLDTRGDAELFIWLLLGSMLVMFVSMAVGMLLLILGAFPLPMAKAHFVAENAFGAAFRLREMGRRIKRNFWGYAVAWILAMGLLMLFYLAYTLIYFTVVLCWLTPLVIGLVGFYFMLVNNAIFARTYHECREKDETEL